MWRRVLVDWPARAWDALWLGYGLCLAAGAIVCLVSALLWLVLSLAGYPLP